MSLKLLEDWNALDVEHKKFIIRVSRGGGCKYSAEPHTNYDPEKPEKPSVAYWKEAERSGFIECTGNYKWITTNKFRSLEEILFFLEPILAIRGQVNEN